MKKALGIAVAALALALAAESARAACCYFAAKDKDINQPGQKAFVSWNPAEKIEAFTVQPKFEGNAVDFGMVIPTPSRPKLDEMPRDFFKDLAIFTILMPLPQQIESPDQMFDARKKMMEGAVPCPAPGGGKGGVVVLEAGVVGSLDYKIIMADESKVLFDWLKENSYSYGGDEKTLQFYIDKKWLFTVMKIDPKQMKKADDGSYTGEVTPTRFTFATEKCVYPLKITQISVKDKTDALFYVQAPDMMDLDGELSWQHSFRVMWLTYVLGCSVNEEQQRELQTRNEWIEKKRAQDPKFETTKLEWARRLTDADMAVLEDPMKNYAQGGLGDMAPGAKQITLDELVKEMRAEHAKLKKEERGDDDTYETEIKSIRDRFAAAKGVIVENPAAPPGKWMAKWLFYPNREAPDEDVKGLARLKGHLEKGRFLTKIRKEIRKDEMSDDLVLVAVGKEREQEYVRIMPTSPP